MPKNRGDQRIEAFRRFSRFYTRQIGLLEEHLLHSPFSLTQGRVLYELAHRKEPSPTDLGQALGLDPGYLSRILSRFRKSGLLEQRASSSDGRRTLLRLTPAGRKSFARLNAASRDQVGLLLERLSGEQQSRLISAMTTIEELLDPPPRERAPYLLRSYRPGDLGWVVKRHGELYAQEYGWDEHFEALVAEVVAKFIREYDPRRECCWIAEREGENVGSVFLIKKSERVAQLRLLLVEPSARSLGIGSRLVAECERLARMAGYRKIVLWTNSVLHAARRIYQKAGYRLVEESPHHSFGHDLIGQNWELELGARG